MLPSQKVEMDLRWQQYHDRQLSITGEMVDYFMAVQTPQSPCQF
jgi:hypothetical protein